MVDTVIYMWRVPEVGFPSAHLLYNITKGKEYSVIGKSFRSKLVVDDVGKEVWISNKLFKKHFKEKAV